MVICSHRHAEECILTFDFQLVFTDNSPYLCEKSGSYQLTEKLTWKDSYLESLVVQVHQ